MMKEIFNSLALCMLTAMTVGMLVACGSDADSEEQPTAPSHGLRVSIPAEMESGTRALSFGEGSGNVQATFATNEKVYVCNVTNNNTVDAVTLSPSANGQTVTLTGTLTGTYTVGDQLKLFYHAGGTASGSANEFSYTGQDGTQASAKTKDFAVATATVGEISEGTLKTTSTALFRNSQSFMRLSFTFTDWDGNTISMPNDITSLIVKSAKNSIATDYNAVANTYTKGDNVVSISNLSRDVYFAIPFDESASNSDVLTFTATTSSTNPPALVYRCTKNAPTQGFKNGRFYSPSAPLSLKEMRIITVGIIDSWLNKTSDYYVHYWGGSSAAGDVLLTADNPQKTESSTIDIFGNPQTWYLLTAGIPKDITGWKIVHDSNGNGNVGDEGDTWFGNDANSSNSKAYLFSWDYGSGNVNRTEYK